MANLKDNPFMRPEILVKCIGIVPYMMPDVLLPPMNCEQCQHRREKWRDGGHCYMFREKPPGDRCGQFKVFPDLPTPAARDPKRSEP